MHQYRINRRGGDVLVRKCEHQQETCSDCPFWTACLPLASFGGKNADKKAKAYLKKLNPNGRLAIDDAARPQPSSRKGART